jgi:hypothetical protein
VRASFSLGVASGVMLAVAASAFVATPSFAADAPPAEAASNLAATKSWDDLYLKFSAAKPDGYSAADRGRIAKALLLGAHGMESTDGVIAVSLAERAVAFEESVEALTYAGELNQKIDQNGQAAKWFERAVAVDAHADRAHLLRAELALRENEPAVANQHLQAISKTFETARVQRDLTRSQAIQAQQKAGEASLDQMQRDVNHKNNTASTSKTGTGSDSGSTSKSGKSGKGKHDPKSIEVAGADDGAPAGGGGRDPLEGAGLAGLREKASEHFTFAYGNNARDWGQRAEYEGKVMAALEEAYEFVGQEMHANRSQPVGVVLYTKEEYDFHFSGSELSRAAGFYSGKIRINGAEEITPEVQAVIVHEYVHAVIDELVASKHIPQWVHEGFATYIENEYRSARNLPGADDAWARQLHQIAKKGGLPKLQQLDVGFLSFGNPRLAYATAGKACQLMIERQGMDSFVDDLRSAAKKPWSQNFAERYGDGSDLDAEILEEMSK